MESKVIVEVDDPVIVVVVGKEEDLVVETKDKGDDLVAEDVDADLCGNNVDVVVASGDKVILGCIGVDVVAVVVTLQAGGGGDDGVPY